ncbi:hypothetical protein ACRQ4B_02550 [Curtobacterium sp. SP.BCo]|uniref:hypothetical protein n=1 Tax=Curtobacterium sp. SP.BCo TaxID=3435229 RepID=UPI003F73861C
MSDDADGEALWRTIVGRPWVWQGVVWIAIGLVWIGLAVGAEGVWRWIAGGIWLGIGVLWLFVAISDRRHGRGRYVGRRA